MMDTALTTLKGRSRAKRTMWSRRAQEYEAKINSGDPVSIAEVVRDLHRSADQPDQSYSERQMYQAALDRLARELAAVEQIDENEAALKLEKLMPACVVARGAAGHWRRRLPPQTLARCRPTSQPPQAPFPPD